MTTCNDTLTDIRQNQIRARATRLFHRDGELEVDNNCPVVMTDAGAEVGCWVWISNDAAGIASNDDHSDDERTEKYLNAVGDVPTDAEFRDDIAVSLGDDEGSYVFGWVGFGVEFDGDTLVPTDSELEAVEGSDESIDLWMHAADYYSRQQHDCPACELLDDPEDGIEVLRESFMNGIHPKQAVADLFRLQAKKLWEKLGDVPVVEGDRIGTAFVTPTITFRAGTEVTEVWHWFEEHYNLSVACDLMGHSDGHNATHAA
ncbi:MAG: Uncharacterized protein AWU57_350 [Marinobacter sp. T13-3]|nr:MAG: Uncharacterized protein AWU57_350 [Marinobacter sp. T13-3]